MFQRIKSPVGEVIHNLSTHTKLLPETRSGNTQNFDKRNSPTYRRLALELAAELEAKEATPKMAALWLRWSAAQEGIYL